MKGFKETKIESVEMSRLWRNGKLVIRELKSNQGNQQSLAYFDKEDKKVFQVKGSETSIEALLSFLGD